MVLFTLAAAALLLALVIDFTVPLVSSERST
jgi:hypothetical protein